MLFEEDGEQVGYEYNTNEIGRIDLLAKHRNEPKWLVIELKRNQSSDETVGQVLRYMGWVKSHRANLNETVHGLIISKIADQRLDYALMSVPTIDILQYEVDFHLKKPGK